MPPIMYNFIIFYRCSLFSPFILYTFFLLFLFFFGISSSNSNCLRYNHPLHAQYFLFYFSHRFSSAPKKKKNSRKSRLFFNICIKDLWMLLFPMPFLFPPHSLTHIHIQVLLRFSFLIFFAYSLYEWL